MSRSTIQGLTASRLVSLLLPLALVGCAVGEAGNPPPASPAPQVTTAAVAMHELHDSAEFTGRLEAVESVHVLDLGAALE